MRVKAPVAYQGGKTRIASKIVDLLPLAETGHFFDLCCGSGAISCEVVGRGILHPSHLTMLDVGPWGMFWELVGKGAFSLEKFSKVLEEIPSEKADIQAYVKELSNQPVDEDAPYIFLVLQAASFGSKPIWIENGVWKNNTFRSYWQPTPTSSRRYPVNPMMPMPEELFSRVERLVSVMYGVRGLHMDLANFVPDVPGIVYIDPPYVNTTRYGNSLDIHTEAKRLASLGYTVYVSESAPLGEEGKSYQISSVRRKGGISGSRKSSNEEWLSVVAADDS